MIIASSYWGRSCRTSSISLYGCSPVAISSGTDAVMPIPFYSISCCLLLGLILATRRNKTWLLTISLCSFIHLVFDQMWLNPATLLWPLLGPIQRGATAGWFSALWHELISDPYVYASETVGFIINLIHRLSPDDEWTSNALSEDRAYWLG